MPLLPATRLGPYEILSPLGAGGMGEVYRARDTRLNRDVALKVLPAEVAQDPARRQRFEQEARAASALNHPNIVTVYDVGTAGGLLFIVSELVDGDSLRAIIQRGPLAVRRAVDLAVQLADGLATAHAAAIVHRDLKPENIMVTREGRVKILDFGLAKQIATAPSAGDATLTYAPTQPGMVLGTAGYMSPEQVRGQAVDARSDIFSFGLILYEMLSGKRAFTGASTADLMSAILKEDPPDLPATLPPALDQMVRHCLEKEPQRRFQSAHDLAFGLRALSGGFATTTQAPAVESAPARRRFVTVLGAGGLLVAGAAAGVFGGKGLWQTPLPTFRQLTYRRGTISGARFAPDGRSVFYSAAWDGASNEVFSTRLDSAETLPMGLAGARLFSVSPAAELALARDARFLWHNSFYGTLARLVHSGDAPRLILTDVAEAEWAPSGDALAVVHMVGGEQRLEYPIGKALYRTAGWISYPRFSPQGDRIAFLDHPIAGDNLGSVAVVDLAGKKTTLSTGWRAAQGLAWFGPNEIWFTAAATGPPKSIHSITLSGRHRVVASLPHRLTLRDISADGRVLLATEMRRSEMIGLAAADKKERDLGWLDNPVPRDLSQDGKLLLFHEQGYRAGGNYSVYLRKTDGSAAVRLGEGSSMSLSPDGKWALSLVPTSPQQLVLLPTGEGEPKALPQAGLNYQWGSAWTPDSRRIVFTANEPGHGSRLWWQDLQGGKPQAFSPEGVSASTSSLSPDGKIAAATGPDGRIALYPVDGSKPRPVPGLAPGDEMIRWSPDGRQLYVYDRFKLPAKVYRLDLTSGNRTFVREFAPADQTGVFQISTILLTPDGNSTVFRFVRVLSDLYVVDGLK